MLCTSIRLLKIVLYDSKLFMKANKNDHQRNAQETIYIRIDNSHWWMRLPQTESTRQRVLAPTCACWDGQSKSSDCILNNSMQNIQWRLHLNNLINFKSIKLIEKKQHQTKHIFTQVSETYSRYAQRASELNKYKLHSMSTSLKSDRSSHNRPLDGHMARQQLAFLFKPASYLTRPSVCSNNIEWTRGSRANIVFK